MNARLETDAGLLPVPTRPLSIRRLPVHLRVVSGRKPRGTTSHALATNVLPREVVRVAALSARVAPGLRIVEKSAIVPFGKMQTVARAMQAKTDRLENLALAVNAPHRAVVPVVRFTKAALDLRTVEKNAIVPLRKILTAAKAVTAKENHSASRAFHHVTNASQALSERTMAKDGPRAFPKETKTKGQRDLMDRMAMLRVGSVRTANLPVARKGKVALEKNRPLKRVSQQRANHGKNIPENSSASHSPQAA